jgi:hypothetical protein
MTPGDRDALWGLIAAKAFLSAFLLVASVSLR